MEVLINPYKRTIGNMSRESIIRFQLVLHCYLNDISLTAGKLQCLTILGMDGKSDLTKFCEKLAEEKVFTSPDSSRNALDHMEDNKLIVKAGKYRKTIQLHPDMKIQTVGNIWVDIDMLCREVNTDN